MTDSDQSKPDEVIDSGMFSEAPPHPRVLPGASLLVFIERLATYIAFSLLIYELMDEHGNAASPENIYSKYMIYLMLLPMLQIPGGWLVDRIALPLRTLLWGGFFLAIGFFILPFGGILEEYPGMVFIAFGSAIFGPSLLSWLGAHYRHRPEGAPLGFAFFLGSEFAGGLMGSVSISYALEWIGWKEGLMIAGILLLGAHIRFFSLKRNTREPLPARLRQNQRKYAPYLFPPMVLSALLLLSRSTIRIGRKLQPEYGTGISSLVDQAAGILIVVFFFAAGWFIETGRGRKLKRSGVASLMIAAASAMLVGSLDYFDALLYSVVITAVALVIMAWGLATLLPTAYDALLTSGDDRTGLYAGLLNAIFFTPYSALLLYTSMNLSWPDPLFNTGSIAILVLGGFLLLREGNRLNA